jgi:hypothetical protein
MSTRSGIGVVMPDGSVFGIYCHSSGGFERGGVGWTLARFYASPERVVALLNLGDCSSLRPGLGRRHEFGKAPANWSTFYGRDRGEHGREVRVYRDVEQFVLERAGRAHVEFLYLWDRDRGWRVCEVGEVVGIDGVGEWIPLVEAIAAAR